MTLTFRAVALPGIRPFSVSGVAARPFGALALAGSTSSERAGIVIVA
jgi:hypothetical protein